MAMETTNINIRMEKPLKEQAERLFAEMGMNMTTAFNIFVRQSVRQRKIPFEISTVNDSNMQARNRFRKTMEEMQAQSAANGTNNMTLEEIIDIIAEVRKETHA